ncbi:type II toxin-antitoxin system HicA family toxin [Jiella pacifica]|uniref:Addiction module toxin, HicA family n=1 Tax=Jiella pacifica TaxID=2696469 RepID=A0A6N9TDG4_9HYPH|nr:type II toxin-antitoxin system HicA family toxin [Jiella pacifica]NDW06908.1 addiction module toxin, HicA family [Jiella pacifica]
MPSLPALSGKTIVRALQRGGFVVLRVSGSHHVLRHPERPGSKVSEPVHGNRDLPTGTLRAILDRSGLTTEEFLDLL